MVEQRETCKDAEPDHRSPCRHRGVGTGAQRAADEHQRQEQLDIAQQVARNHRLGGQAPGGAIAAGAGRDADAGQPFARGGPARSQFEPQEPGGAGQKHRNDPDDQQEFQQVLARGAILELVHADRAGKQHDQQCRDDDGCHDHAQIDHQRRRACAARRQRDRQAQALGGQDRAFAPLGRADRAALAPPLAPASDHAGAAIGGCG